MSGELIIRVTYINIDDDDFMSEGNRLGKLLTEINAIYQEPNFYMHLDDGEDVDLIVTEGELFVEEQMLWEAMHMLGTHIGSEKLEEGIDLSDEGNGITWAQNCEYNGKRGILFNLEGYDENFWYDYE